MTTTPLTSTDGVSVRPMCKSDEAYLCIWLAAFLRAQLSLWAQSLKLDWSAEFIEARLARTGQIHREYSALASAAEDPLKLVRVAAIDGVAVGVVYAESRKDRYLSEEIGVVSWIYVVPESRRTGIAQRLIRDALDWMNEKGLLAAELFVTNANTAARGLYEKVGYTEVDSRMLLRLPNTSAFPRTESVE